MRRGIGLSRPSPEGQDPVFHFPGKERGTISILQSLLFFAVSFLASIVGAICGIGGGVIIKPVLDLFGWAGVSTISFLSGCTVLSMSLYSVGRSVLAGEKSVDLHTGTPLAAGAAVGGVVGKQMFTAVRAASSDPNRVGGVQAVCLALITFLVLVYVGNKSRIHTRKIRSPFCCLLIGLVLGIMSSFLGIGGGPINLAVLYFFFSMDSKTAAANSLYIILFSQITSLLATLLTRTVPDFTGHTLLLMVLGGIGGGMVGRAVNKRMDNRMVDRLFTVLLVVIIAISLCNAWRYF